MVNILVAASLIAQLTSATLISLGVLTPEMVCNLGARLASYVLAKPNSLLLKRAHARVFESRFTFHFEIKDFKEFLAALLAPIVEWCVIELSVSILTAVLAEILSVLLLFGLSLWGIVVATHNSGPHPLLWSFSAAGMLIATCGFCAIFEPSEKSSLSNNAFGRLVVSVLHTGSRAWCFAYPLRFLMEHMVSLFVKTMPLLWFRSLKTIHARGINWFFTLIGFTLFVLSLALQFCVLLMAR